MKSATKARPISAVIVAAGMSSRMGSFKPLLPLGNSTIIGTLVQSCLDAGALDVVVVAGNRADELERHLLELHATVQENPVMGMGKGQPGEKQSVPARVVLNPDYATSDMAASVRIGFEALNPECEQVLFSPVDVPLWLPSTAKILLDSKSKIAVPVFRGTKGHPLMLDASIIGALLGNLGDGGLRNAIRQIGESIEEVEVNDEGCIYDADTPDQYRHLLDIYDRRAK